jgi:hypothetical protein
MIRDWSAGVDIQDNHLWLGDLISKIMTRANYREH